MNNNSESTLLLYLILAVLLFGSGAVLGFFSTLFWIIVIIAIIIGGIWFLSQMPRAIKEVAKEEVNEFKGEYRKFKSDPLGFKKHPIYAPIFWGICLIIFLWLIISLMTQSDNKTKVNTQSLDISTPQIVKNKFPEENRNLFLKNCIKSADGVQNAETYCSCALENIEANYTLSQFAQMEATYTRTNSLPEGLKNAFEQCINKVKD